MNKELLERIKNDMDEEIQLNIQGYDFDICEIRDRTFTPYQLIERQELAYLNGYYDGFMNAVRNFKIKLTIDDVEEIDKIFQKIEDKIRRMEEEQ